MNDYERYKELEKRIEELARRVAELEERQSTTTGGRTFVFCNYPEGLPPHTD